MKPRDELMELLSDQGESLTDALLLTRIVACRQIEHDVAGGMLAGEISAYCF